MSIAFVREMNFEYGRATELSPLVRRVVARNPGPFTFHGTGTYLIGHSKVAVIDPGPDLDEHLAALQAALHGATVTHVLVTHSHRDHCASARRFAALNEAPVYAFGPHPRHRIAGAVEEGADTDFHPDFKLDDGVWLSGEGWTLQALHTPGHTSNHLCFALAEERALFCGDHVMGWSTSVIAPPDGDMRAYIASLERLEGREDTLFYPTHGPPLTDPRAMVRAYLAHRREREEQIRSCLRSSVCLIPEMVRRMYPSLPTGLLPAAGASVLAHLISMIERAEVECEGDVALSGIYRLR